MATPRGPIVAPAARPLYARQPGVRTPGVQRTEQTAAFRTGVRSARSSLAGQIAANAAAKRAAQKGG